MRFIVLSSLLLLVSVSLWAQTNIGLVAHYTFENQLADAVGNTANTAIPQGDIEYRCGVEGQALYLNGATAFATVLNGNNVNAEFDTEDFTISFYFKPTGINGQQYILSKRSIDCTGEQEFYIRYVPASRTFNAHFSEIPQKTVSLVETISNNACWQHITIVRDDIKIKLYINGVYATELGTATRLDIFNDGDLYIGNADCLGLNEVPFEGYLDELRVYNRALPANEVKTLYNAPDVIMTSDTLLFLGNEVDIEIANTCASSFEWTPDNADISSSSVATPTITPSEAGVFVYEVEFIDQEASCTAIDSIRINVVDPDLLPCDQLFLPKAFTPNGDGLNETFGISNSFAVEQLNSFEIYDRWGNQLFYTNDPQQKWDGTYDGQDVNSGVVLFKINYVCDGVERNQTGSVTILR